MAGERWSRMNHSYDRRYRAGRARHEQEDVVQMEREARETRPRASVVTCQGCGAVNLVEANGVPKIQCNGCGKVLVARAALPRTESR